MLVGLLLAPTLALAHAPNVSLASVPCAYFGGTYRHRGDANIAMLAKMRLVMLEKWEGNCWQDCINHKIACNASCGVENALLDTHSRVKALNPGVASVFYWNTLLSFPFYAAAGQFAAANALTIDSTTGVPIEITNDGAKDHQLTANVFGYDTEAGVQLYVDTVKNISATGVIDGFFGDKWDFGAAQNEQGQWQICNHECGNVTAAQAAAWNAGKAKALAATTAFVGDGPYYANGAAGNFGGVGSNLNGHFSNDPYLKSGDPRDSIKDVKAHLANHTFFYMSCTSDQHWTTDPNAASTLKTFCSDSQLARFLLSVEPGCFLGTNGWSPDYERPLGDPLAPAAYSPAQGASRPATLNRSFASGTYVTFTYDAKGTDGTAEIFWDGKPPATPAPTPPPPPPTPPPPTPAPITCGSSTSSLLFDTSFAGANMGSTIITAAAGCCYACAANAKCATWAFHDGNVCHLHGPSSERKAQPGTTAGRLDGRAAAAPANQL